MAMRAAGLVVFLSFLMVQPTVAQSEMVITLCSTSQMEQILSDVNVTVYPHTNTGTPWNFTITGVLHQQLAARSVDFDFTALGCFQDGRCTPLGTWNSMPCLKTLCPPFVRGPFRLSLLWTPKMYPHAPSYILRVVGRKEAGSTEFVCFENHFTQPWK